MPLDKAEILDLLKALFDELYGAYKDDQKITLEEWLGLAQRVGVKTFQEVTD